MMNQMNKTASEILFYGQVEILISSMDLPTRLHVLPFQHDDYYDLGLWDYRLSKMIYPIAVQLPLLMDTYVVFVHSIHEMTPLDSNVMKMNIYF